MEFFRILVVADCVEERLAQLFADSGQVPRLEGADEFVIGLRGWCIGACRADITHRQHAIIETVFADLIDGPLAHLPSGRFGANSAWILCAAIAHNLLRAAGALAGDQHSRARGSTLRRRIINVPARLARPQHRPILHLPTHWPWSKPWLALWHNTIGHSPPLSATP